MLRNFKKYTVRRVFLHFSTSISVHLYRFSHIYREFIRSLLISFLMFFLVGLRQASCVRTTYTIPRESRVYWCSFVSQLVNFCQCDNFAPFLVFFCQAIQTLNAVNIYCSSVQRCKAFKVMIMADFFKESFLFFSYP